MRYALAVVLALGATAYAVPERTVIKIPPRQGPAAALSSNIIYLHRCQDAGCPIHAGSADDSRTTPDTSQIAQGDRTIGAFNQSEQVWQAMVQCVKDTYAAFDITVTGARPTPAIPEGSMRLICCRPA